MELGGIKRFRWFGAVPDINDNCALDESVRLSLEVRRMSAFELAEQKEWQGNDSIYAWRDSTLHKIAFDEDDKAAIDRAPAEMLVEWRQFGENTRAWRNATVDGEAIVDPFLLFLHVYGTPLYGVVVTTIKMAAILNGEQLKNFTRRVSGIDTAEDAQHASTDSAPPLVDTPPVEIGQSS